MFEKKKSEPQSERPLECGECKKSIAVLYTEIIGDSITHTVMCADCPELQRRLHGANPQELLATQFAGITGLECGNCGTTLEQVKRGHSLGCPDCYTVFEDVLLLEMQATHSLKPHFSMQKKGLPLHVGHTPGTYLTINPSSRLLALNEALNETLHREDYEQAALLRDQIRALTENDKLIDPIAEKPPENKTQE
jgi:protein arginine kinase activator